MNGRIDNNGRLPTILLAILGIAWHVGWVYGYPRLFGLEKDALRQNPPLMFFHFVVLFIVWYLLVLQYGGYFYAVFVFFGPIFNFLPFGWALGCVFIIPILFVFAEAELSNSIITLNDPGLWILLATTTAGSLFAFWIRGIIAQSMDRRQLFEQLQQAQADLAASERRAGQLEERQRLAHEIHDTLAQGFISIILNLETAVSNLDESNEAVHYVNLAAGTARHSLTEARRVVDNLRPEQLEKATSLPEAIGQVAERWEKESGTAVTVQVTGQPTALKGSIDVALLRATQEALANVRKHAQATAVQVTLSYMGDVVILDVQDNGTGLSKRIHPDAGSGFSPGGYGLKAMRERVEALQGEVELESDEGEGTTLVVSIPVEKNGA
ncbi:MAG: sensor histidine kinase [Chloroflexota bacterium]